jgi:hypothetical protein
MEFRVTASGVAKLPDILEVGSRRSDVGNRNSGRAARKMEVGGRRLEVISHPGIIGSERNPPTW